MKPTNIFKSAIITALFLSSGSLANAQAGSWQLWASGLTPGAFPRLTIAPNHDIFFVRMSSGGITPGILYKANTLSATGNFTAMPAIPVPASLVNNVYSITTNKNSEPIAGIFRSNFADPWLFRFNNTTQQWVTATTSTIPTLGAYTMERAPNGTIWVGGKWSLVYKSTDNGNTYTGIDESANISAAYPCFFPTWGGSTLDGAIYGLNIDKNGRVYIGTETSGLLYSDDQGITWKPVDYHLCKTNFPTQRDTFSSMRPANYGGNCAGIGFTINNDVVWSGGEMWIFNWPNEIALANMTNHTISPAVGIPNALITSGQQVSKLVTATNGQMFLHSGGASGATGIGIYTSMDGINWTLFNTGITGINTGQSQGSLAVDGNTVFMATQDGQVWKYNIPIVLPIQLINFSGSARGTSNYLVWNMISETNIHFEIERSADALNFHTIGNQQATGNPGASQSFNYVDRQPLDGTNYYRLKEIDPDGSFKYSTVVKIIKGVTDYYLYPTVTNGLINIHSNTTIDIEKVRIFNTSGQEFHLNPMRGPYSVQYDLSGLHAGVYYFEINNNEQRFTERVVRL